MVRLKGIKKTRLKNIFFNFNSTMVRLKVLFQTHYKHRIDSFQFHYGTIKRLQVAEAEVEAEAFQFHYGTIKRFRHYPNLSILFHFNSTMVRLKGCNRDMLRTRYSISIPLWYD